MSENDVGEALADQARIADALDYIAQCKFDHNNEGDVVWVEDVIAKLTR